MIDIQLSANGDLLVDEAGDIMLTDSVRQAAMVRLRWILGEWRYYIDAGVPYFEEILKKKPDIERIRMIIHDEVMSVEEVRDVRDIHIVINQPERSAAISLAIYTDEATYREEVKIDGNLWSHE